MLTPEPPRRIWSLGAEDRGRPFPLDKELEMTIIELDV
jgi:hypothetical protein